MYLKKLPPEVRATHQQQRAEGALSHGTQDVQDEVDQGEIDHLVICARWIEHTCPAREIRGRSEHARASERANERAHGMG